MSGSNNLMEALDNKYRKMRDHPNQIEILDQEKADTDFFSKQNIVRDL